MTTIYDVHTDNLVVRTCWCGIRYAIPSNLNRQVDDKKKSTYCPLGHQGWVSISRYGRLERQLARERARNDQTQARLRDEAEHYKRSAAAQKGAKTRIKNRITNGVCPCCNRHFKNLYAHMQGQHPDYSKKSDD